jgi:hypothetical protein
MEAGGEGHAPAAVRPETETYPVYWGLGGPLGLSGRVATTSPPPGLDPQTVQPVSSL